MAAPNQFSILMQSIEFVVQGKISKLQARH